MNDRVFTDRKEAGSALADTLAEKGYEKPVVLALPRGGVPVARVVADRLDAPLDLVLVRKIGVPYQPELAVGAVVNGDEPEVVINEDVRRLAGVSDEQLEKAKQHELAEIDRRRALYLKDRPRAEIKGSTAIVVDDGIATGATVRAALRALRNRGPARLVLATAVAPQETVDDLALEADEIVCLQTPEPFYAISLYYLNFHQVSDREVIELLAANK